MTKPATLLGVSRASFSEIMSAYTNHGKTTSAKRNSGRKSTRTERDRRILRRIVSKHHRTTAAQVREELNIHPEYPIFTMSDVSFTNPTSTVGLQLLNL
jgi:transposase